MIPRPVLSRAVTAPYPALVVLSNDAAARIGVHSPPALPRTVSSGSTSSGSSPAPPSDFHFSCCLTETCAGVDSRCAPLGKAIPMVHTTTTTQHVLSVHLPGGFDTDMITVAVRNDNMLAVVADKWAVETNSHHEWKAIFEQRDVNLSSVSAKFDSTTNILTIAVDRERFSGFTAAV